MAVYSCLICGYRYDEDATGRLFTDEASNWKCPVCGSDRSLFEAQGGGASGAAAETPSGGTDAETGAKSETDKNQDEHPLAWPSALTRHDQSVMDEIHSMAETGRSVTEPMDTRKATPAFDDILILGAQLDRLPLDDGEEVELKTILGKHAKRPLVIDMPVFISHMSFGALSAESKIALAKGASLAGTATCSGEGGILPAEREQAKKYIFEYVPNLYSVSDENLRNSDAIEIKIGQGTKPGMGGHLPGAKVTAEIARIRNKPEGQDILSPSHFPGIKTAEDMRALVDELRERSGGRPIGIKIAAGHIERDLAFIVKTGADFVTVDGRGGATGSSPKFLKDHATVPTLYALHRAVKYLRKNAPEMELVITGGFRSSGDVVKALAMGATAVAMASAPLMACACQRYRVCHMGTCPMGIATQDPELRRRLIVEKGAQRVANFMQLLASELKSFCRCMGRRSHHELCQDDLITISRDIAKYCRISHAGKARL